MSHCSLNNNETYRIPYENDLRTWLRNLPIINLLAIKHEQSQKKKCMYIYRCSVQS